MWTENRFAPHSMRNRLLIIITLISLLDAGSAEKYKKNQWRRNDNISYGVVCCDQTRWNFFFLLRINYKLTKVSINLPIIKKQIKNDLQKKKLEYWKLFRQSHPWWHESLVLS